MPQTKKLSPCWKKFFSRWAAPDVVNNFTIVDSAPFWMASAGMAGVTRNDNLYVGQGTFDETISSDVSFFGHELWHSQQFRHEGFSIGVYFGSSVVTAYDMFSISEEHTSELQSLMRISY